MEDFSKMLAMQWRGMDAGPGVATSMRPGACGLQETTEWWQQGTRGWSEPRLCGGRPGASPQGSALSVHQVGGAADGESGGPPAEEGVCHGRLLSPHCVW